MYDVVLIVRCMQCQISSFGLSGGGCLSLRLGLPKNTFPEQAVGWLPLGLVDKPTEFSCMVLVRTYGCILGIEIVTTLKEEGHILCVHGIAVSVEVCC